MDESPYRNDLAAANAEIDRLQLCTSELEAQRDILQQDNKQYAERLREARQAVTFLGMLKHVLTDSSFLFTLSICTIAFCIAAPCTIYCGAKLFAP